MNAHFIRPHRALAMAVAFSCLHGVGLHAETPGDYPTRPIRIVVSYPPGGGTDAAARQMAHRIEEGLKATTIVENRPGAGGGLGTLQVARSAPDGYTLAVGGVGTQIAVTTLFPELKLDPMKELTGVALLASSPHALVVGADSPFMTTAQLVAQARARKDGLVYASGGAGSTTHLAVEMFAAAGGLQLNHVPYKGSSPAHTDVVSGRVDFMMDLLSAVTPLVKAGRLRLLAVTTANRLPQFPDVPTVSEVPGFAGYEAISWTGLFAPKGTDPRIIRKLSDALNSRNGESAFRAKVEANGAIYTPMPAAQFNTFVKSEYDRWHPLAEKSAK